MQPSSKYINNLKRLVAQNRASHAIQEIKSLIDSYFQEHGYHEEINEIDTAIILQSANLKHIKEEKNSGNLKTKKFLIILTEIHHAILHIINCLHGLINKEPSLEALVKKFLK